MSVPARSLWDRFWPKVDASGDCWLWTGATIRGYGVIWVNETRRAGRAPRVAWELLVGPIPDGLTIDHLCRVPLCVNPDHLELVTAGENSRRNPAAPWSRKARQTRCKRGHEFTPDNTQRHHGRRSCRRCVADAQRARRARQRAGGGGRRA